MKILLELSNIEFNLPGSDVPQHQIQDKPSQTQTQQTQTLRYSNYY